MKKTLMTFVAVGFGVSVAFAQVTGTEQDAPTQDTEYNQQDQQTDQVYGQAEEGKKKVEMHELPVGVQDAFRNSQYNEMEVLAIYEMSDDENQEQATEGVGTTGEEQDVTYAFELAESGTTEQGALGQEGTTDDGMGDVETERVSERQPDMIIHFDETGMIVKEKDADEMEEEKEKKSEY